MHRFEEKHGLFNDLCFRTFPTLNLDPSHFFYLLDALTFITIIHLTKTGETYIRPIFRLHLHRNYDVVVKAHLNLNTNLE